MREICVSFEKPCRAFKSASSRRLLFVKTRVVRFGRLEDKDAEIVDIRFWAQSKVCNRGNRGKLARAAMLLSVRSIHSWSCAAPRFSIEGILWP